MIYYTFSHMGFKYYSEANEDTRVADIKHFCVYPDGKEIPFPWESRSYPNQSDFTSFVENKLIGEQ